jgi:hypothetical protein
MNRKHLYIQTGKTAFLLLMLALSIRCFGQSVSKDTALIYRAFLQDKNSSILPDFSYAGYHYGDQPLPGSSSGKIINVTQHSIVPGTGMDVLPAVQRLLDSVGQAGGGVVFFPKGTYLFNMDSLRPGFLQLNYSHVVIRGEGSDSSGTVFYDGSTLVQEKISPWLSPFLIQTGYHLQGTEGFWGLDYPADTIKGQSIVQEGRPRGYYPAKVITTITANAKKGDTVIHVKAIGQLHNGSYILIGMFNNSDEGTLLKEIMQPYRTFEDYELAANKAGSTRAPSYQWLAQVKKVLPGGKLILMQPLRRDLQLIYNPVVAAAPMLTEIGIEDIRMESAWNGYYCHHGCEPGNKHQAELMDYGWNAINLCRVANGWVSNVAIHNFTNPVYLLDSRNITIQNLSMSGHDGHSGIKIYGHANDNLVEQVQVYCNYTHVLSGEGNASGNVFREITYYPFDRKPGDFDFHGFADDRFTPPSENLFENISGMHQVSGGGGPSRLPHTANFNTWWNVREAGFGQSKELFYSWLWGPGSKYAVVGKQHHRLYPRSIVVGMYNSKTMLEIEGSSEDKLNDPWIYVEHFNKGEVWPHSLYKAQYALRKQQR